MRGLLNVQYALKDDVLYVLEANPRASRTVPFVSKATAVPLAKAAARVMLGATIAELRAEGLLPGRPATAPTLPARRADRREGGGAALRPLPHREGEGVDTVLGPEMKSTGEVMGIDAVFGTAFAKSQAAAYGELPTKGRVFVSRRQPRQAGDDLPGEAAGRPRLRGARDRGHRRGAAPQRRARAASSASTAQGRGDDVVPLILAGGVDLIINTPFGRRRRASTATRSARRPWRAGVPCITTIQGAAACVQGIEALVRGDIGVRSLQEHHAALAAPPRRAATSRRSA